MTGEAPLIETSNASTGEVLDKRTLDMLPSISRMAYLVSNTVPTVVSTGNPHMNRMQDQTEVARTSLGGGASVANNYLLDGFPITDIQNRPSAMPSIEMLEDVKVQIHTYDSEMGRTGGGVFNATAKSGNHLLLHGSAFGLVRPNSFIGNNFFLGIQGLPKPDQFWHNYGGSFGGPLLDDKTFFWVAAEGYRDGLTQNGNWHLPTEAERSGDFSKLTDSSGRPILIYDPLTTGANGSRLAFPEKYQPAIRPRRGQMVSRQPDQSGRCEYSQATPTTQRQSRRGRRKSELRDAEHAEQQWLPAERKVQRNVNANASLTGVDMRQYTEEPGVTWFSGPNTGGAQNNRPINVGVVNNTYVMNASTVLALRVGYNTFEDQTPVRDPFDPEQLGFSRTFLDAIPDGQEKFPTINPTGYLGTVGSGGGKSRLRGTAPMER